MQRSASSRCPACPRAATVYGDSEPDRHVASAIAKPTGRGWRLDKLGRSDQIDAVIALCMAVERAQHVPEPVRVLAWVG